MLGSGYAQKVVRDKFVPWEVKMVGSQILMNLHGKTCDYEKAQVTMCIIGHTQIHPVCLFPKLPCSVILGWDWFWCWGLSGV